MRRSLLARSLVFCALVTTIILSLTPRSRADGTFIAAGARIDMVHSFDSDVVYITNGSAILAYRVGTNTTLYRILIESGANLMGIDLSPDGKTLAIADNRFANNQVWIWLVDTSTLAVTKVAFPQAFGEGGTFTVAYGVDGSIFVSTTFQGSGWVPLRRYFPATGSTVTVLNSVRQNTMLVPSGDATIIGFAESNSSTGPVGRVRVSDGNVIRYEDYAGGTSWFNYEIGANRDGTQFAVPTYNGAYVYNGEVLKTGKIVGTYAGPQPMGVVYHPVEDLVYFPWATTYDIRCFNTNTWAQTASYYFENYFDHPGNGAFKEGRLKMSRDGSLLFATVANGVRFLRLYTGLTATDQSATVDEDSSVGITLGGSIGNGGALTWSIVSPPSHGTLSGAPPSVTYTPSPDYSGPDGFAYKVSYGRAARIAKVYLTANPQPDAPVAQDDAASTANGSAVSVNVLANDSDSDGDSLTVSAATQGSKGAVTINPDKTVTYTPQVAFNGADTFSYVVDDGTGRTATATVTITSTYDEAGLLYGLSVSPTTVAGGANATGTVKLSHSISLPIDVALSSTNPAAAVPATVTIPAGSVSATFPVTTTPVGVKTTGYVKATLGPDTRSATINVRPVSVKSVTFNPSSVVGGHSSAGTVTLEAPAGPDDVPVSLGSLSPLVRVTDGTGNLISGIVIPAGSTTATFYVQTDPVDLITKAKVRATVNGLYKEGTLSLKPIPVASIKLSPTSVRGGGISTATITLMDPAAPGDVTVTLSSANASVAWFVDGTGNAIGSVVVPAGTKAVVVGVQTASVAAKTSVSLRAAAGGVTRSATLTVTP